MSVISYVNGAYIDHKYASVHIEDRGYQFGDGVYEVFSIFNSNIIDYESHINRLFRSLSEINLKSPYKKKSYLFHIKNIIRKNYII